MKKSCSELVMTCQCRDHACAEASAHDSCALRGLSAVRHHVPATHKPGLVTTLLYRLVTGWRNFIHAFLQIHLGTAC